MIKIKMIRKQKGKVQNNFYVFAENFPKALIKNRVLFLPNVKEEYCNIIKMKTKEFYHDYT